MSKKMKITLAVIFAFIVCAAIAVYLSLNGHEEEGKSQAIFVSRQKGILKVEGTRIPMPHECGDAGNMTAPQIEIRHKMYIDRKRIKEVDER